MNKKRLIITSVISIFLVSILLIGSTYSIFTSQEIDESANVYKTGNLEVSYNESGEVQVDPIPKSEEEADGITPYTITVTNNGNVPYQFDVILTDTTSSSDNTINYDYIMTKVGYLDTKSLSDCTNNIIKEDVILLAGESVEIDIRVWVSDTIPNSEIGKSFYAKLTIDGLAVYNDSKEINNDNLSLKYMKKLFTSYSENTYFKSTYRTSIKTASFVDYIDTSNAISSTSIWDISLDGDNSVVAWLENNETSGYYDLYIGANHKIYASNESLYAFFSNLTGLTSINFDNLSTSMSTTMQYMFYSCTGLTSLDLSSFNTSKVTTMYYMFYNCNKLTSLDLSNFDTSNVTTMYYMFCNCNKLTSLDLSNFDTSNVTTMYYMFRGCSSLTSLDLRNFDTSNVTTMAYMFYGCTGLTSLDLSSFDTSKVTTMISMFYNCTGLTSLDVSNFNTSNVTTMAYMFRSCQNLTSLDLSSFDTSKVTSMTYMFYYCSSLTSLDLSSFDTSKVTTMTYMFSYGNKLTTTITIRNTSTTYTSMFTSAATTTGAKITVNYTSATSTRVDSMISTKSSTSNVVKGSLVV